MSRFETIVDSKKNRIPQKPRFFSLIGYNGFRFPHVFNYFILEGYVVYVEKNRSFYSVVTDGWKYSESVYDCSFEHDGLFTPFSGLSHVSAIERFSDVCSQLQKCFVFDVITRPRYEYVYERIEQLAYVNHSAGDAESIILDKIGHRDLFDELS